MFVAYSWGHDTIVHYLLFNKANVNVIDNKGHTYLYKACSNGKTNLTKHLLLNGANPNLDKECLEIVQRSGYITIEALLQEYVVS